MPAIRALMRGAKEQTESNTIHAPTAGITQLEMDGAEWARSSKPGGRADARMGRARAATLFEIVVVHKLHRPTARGTIIVWRGQRIEMRQASIDCPIAASWRHRSLATREGNPNYKLEEEYEEG